MIYFFSSQNNILSDSPYQSGSNQLSPLEIWSDSSKKNINDEMNSLLVIEPNNYT